MYPRLLIHVRHGQSLGNLHSEDERAGLAMSTADYPLTELGKDQARTTGTYLREEFGKFDVAFTSHYIRARETLAELRIDAKKTIIEPLLAESNRGIWHVMTKAEVGAVYPNEVRRKKIEGLYHHRSLGGENNADVEMRIALFEQRLAREFVGKKVLVIVHGTWQLLFERRLHNQTPEEFIERYHNREVVANASATIYTSRRRFLWGGRVELTKKTYIIPWQGKLAPAPEVIA